MSVFLFQYLSLSSTHAQITLDGSLGPQGPLAGPNYTINANVGKQVGGNLFHSFGEFNVNTGESATFTGPNTVDNIIGRVTGGNPSEINGVLRSTIPDANLYLVNPSGVLFGPNASLDVGGSFHVSTADYLKLGENGRFDATTPSNSLLTSAPPEAFGFLGPNPAPIFAAGTETSLLQVPEGEILSIVGGDIQMIGTNLRTQGGQINVVSVASPGEVGQHAPEQPGGIDVSSFSRLGSIDLQGTSLIDSGEGGGSIVIRGGQLAVENSAILSVTRGAIDGKDVDIRVTDTVINKTGNIGVVTAGEGRGGDLIVETGRLQVSEGGALLTGSGLGPGSVGTGDSGDLIIRATDSVVLSNGQLLSATYRQGNAGNIKIATPKFTLDSDGIVANITSGAGDAGSINVESERVSLTQGAKISSGTFSTGRGGDVTITASDSVFISGHSNSDPQSRTGVGSQTAGGGDAGDLQISTPEFNMDGGAISSGTIKGSGNAGNIEISVERANLTGGAIITGSTLQGSSGHGGTITFTASKSITIAGSSPDGSPNLITSLTIGSGNAGRIFLSTPELTMSQGEITTFAFDTSTGHAGDIELQVGRATLTGTGQPLGSSQFLDQASINSTSRNTEQGGTIKITASDSVVLSGPGVEILSEADGGGESGTIDLHAKDIQLTDGATISSKNTATRDGGNVTITATETFRSDNGRVTTTAANANGGNITIGAGALAHISRSEISAAVRSEQGKGGNITIEPTSTVLNRSTITANAFGGPGGNVRITSDVFLASPDSSVTASSALGVDGLVDIQSPITSISGSFAPLPETFVNVSELLPVRCAARLRDGQASSFVVRGRDALPTSPDGVLPSPILRRDKTNTVGSNAASVTGWGDASVSQASVEVDCWR